MAVKDVRNYYYTMLAQYLEEKQNLEDFAEALKNGQITEDQMQEVMNTVADLEANYHRLSYIMYLLDMPNRPEKKPGYTRQQKVIKRRKYYENYGSEILESPSPLAVFEN